MLPNYYKIIGYIYYCRIHLNGSKQTQFTRQNNCTSYRLVQVNQTNKTPSALETPFSFESLFSDQRMTLTFSLSHFDYKPYSVIRNMRISVKQQQQHLRLIPFRMSQ